MKRITYSEMRQNLTKTMDMVIKDQSPLIIKRPKGKGDVVLMSLQEYESLQDTFYLLKSPNNAKSLLDAVKGLENLKDITTELVSKT